MISHVLKWACSPVAHRGAGLTSLWLSASVLFSVWAATCRSTKHRSHMQPCPVACFAPALAGHVYIFIREPQELTLLNEETLEPAAIGES